MNQRIKELLVKSGMLYRATLSHIDAQGIGQFDESFVYDNFDPIKFADLIVQECANLFEDDGTASSMNEYLCNTQAKETILKHFEIMESKRP